MKCYICEKEIELADKHIHHVNERSKDHPRPKRGRRMALHRCCHAWKHGWKYGWMKNQRKIWLEKFPEYKDMVDIYVN